MTEPFYIVENVRDVPDQGSAIRLCPIHSSVDILLLELDPSRCLCPNCNYIVPIENIWRNRDRKHNWYHDKQRMNVMIDYLELDNERGNEICAWCYGGSRVRYHGWKDSWRAQSSWSMEGLEPLAERSGCSES